jgi:hypothetical protein
VDRVDEFGHVHPSFRVEDRFSYHPATGGIGPPMGLRNVQAACGSARGTDPAAEGAGFLDGAAYRSLNMEQDPIYDQQAPITVKGAAASADLAVPLRARHDDLALTGVTSVSARAAQPAGGCA